MASCVVAIGRSGVAGRIRRVATSRQQGYARLQARALFCSGHRDKTDGQDGFLVNLRTVLLQQVKLLIIVASDRDDHSTAVSQLFD